MFSQRVVQECGRCGLLSPPLPADEASRWAKDHVSLCAALSAERVPDETHVDRVGWDLRPGTERLLGRYSDISHPDIGGQERDGRATYVYISQPHTMAECPFPAELVPRGEPSLLLAATQKELSSWREEELNGVRVPTPITDEMTVERLTIAGDRLLDVVREYAPSPATTGAAIRQWVDAKAALNGGER